MEKVQQDERNRETEEYHCDDSGREPEKEGGESTPPVENGCFAFAKLASGGVGGDARFSKAEAESSPELKILAIFNLFPAHAQREFKKRLITHRIEGDMKSTEALNIIQKLELSHYKKVERSRNTQKKQREIYKKSKCSSDACGVDKLTPALSESPQMKAESVEENNVPPVSTPVSPPISPPVSPPASPVAFTKRKQLRELRIRQASDASGDEPKKIGALSAWFI